MEPGILVDTARRPMRRRAVVQADGPRPEDCPVYVTLDVIVGRWKPLALYHLYGGMRRFNELRRMMPGVTQRMLTATLRELERDGIVRREVFPEVPPRVEYTMTPRGESLRSLLEAMARWGTENANGTTANRPLPSPSHHAAR